MTMPKIDKRKKYTLILDTETAGGLDQKLIYDFGYVIADRQGNILFERSYLVKEIWEQKELIQSAYYAEKIPMYEKGVKAKKFKVEKWYNIREELLNALDYFDKVDTIAAYNLGFDLDALSKTMAYITDNEFKFFFPKKYSNKLKRVCIWTLACQLLFPQKSYINFAIKNNLFSAKGNFLTNAEVAYSYITDNNNYKEHHTALEDVKIELEILTRCLRQKKKIISYFMESPWKFANNKMRI